MFFCFFFLENIGDNMFFFFFSSRRRHTRLTCDWSSDVCSSDLARIANTYQAIQRDKGTWWLKVDKRTGKPIAEIDLIPSMVIVFLDRLVTKYGEEKYRPTLERAVK